MVHQTGGIGPMIGRKGLESEAWSHVIEYGFHRLGLRKIVGGAVLDNKARVAIL